MGDPSEGSLCSYPSLLGADLQDLRNGLEKRRFTSVQLVKAYQRRICEVNHRLNAVIETNPDAVSIAAQLDVERLKGAVRGPLHGLPILIKDNIATCDHMGTTAGSLALKGAQVPRDSSVVAKLRQAGVIMLGKANLSEWANYRSLNSSNGWSAVGGQTKGAYHPDQDPSGSSSGSAVAASLGLAWAALGTETTGSIVMPAQMNNVIGIKPTVGLTSRYLIVPASRTMDTVGPITRSVKDAAYLLQVIAGSDMKDELTLKKPFHQLPNYVKACKSLDLRGTKLGVPRNVLEFYQKDVPEPIRTTFDGALDLLRMLGASMMDTEFTALAEAVTSEDEVSVAADEIPEAIANYFDQLSCNPHNVRSLEDLVDFTKRTSAEQFPARDIVFWEKALDMVRDADGFRARSAREAGEYLRGPGGILGALDRQGLDAIVLPTVLAWRFAGIIGTPVVTVPMGSYPPESNVRTGSFGALVQQGPNIPFGLGFMGRKWSESDLISLAYAYEQATMVRSKVVPCVLPTTELNDIEGA